MQLDLGCNLSTHQPRQQQVARSAQFLVLLDKDYHLAKKWRSKLFELLDERMQRHKNLGFTDLYT